MELRSTELKMTELKITGMSCQHCVRHVTQALSAVPGVREADVRLAEGRALVRHENADPQALLAAVEDAGYEAEVMS